MYHEKHMKCSQTFTVSFRSLATSRMHFLILFFKWIVVEFWSNEIISLKPGHDWLIRLPFILIFVFEVGFIYYYYYYYFMLPQGIYPTRSIRHWVSDFHGRLYSVIKHPATYWLICLCRQLRIGHQGICQLVLFDALPSNIHALQVLLYYIPRKKLGSETATLIWRATNRCSCWGPPCAVAALALAVSHDCTGLIVVGTLMPQQGTACSHVVELAISLLVKAPAVLRS